MSTEAALHEIAARYVWWQPPEVTLARRHHFLCQVMALGTEEDVTTVRRTMGDPALLDALEHAPPGVMDPKSWNFWHLFFGRRPPPLPERPLP
ncbi:hypothetical protein [Sorangium sp. So ce381]|uniref:hypothetical protein n=1 Tax=Sorangium sp. So ce381 TaxID=3133307 RepID=UPI003F5B0D69